MKYKKNSKILLMGIISMFVTFQVIAVNQDTRPSELTYGDKKLNRYYQKIMHKLPPSAREKLSKAQSQWILFRDLDCAWAFDSVPLDCLIARTDSRIRELRETVFTDVHGNYTSIELDDD